jgi:hypothetical protein
MMAPGTGALASSTTRPRSVTSAANSLAPRKQNTAHCNPRAPAKNIY